MNVEYYELYRLLTAIAVLTLYVLMEVNVHLKP